MGMRACVRARAGDVTEIGQQINRPALPTGALDASWRQSGEMTGPYYTRKRTLQYKEKRPTIEGKESYHTTIHEKDTYETTIQVK